MDTIDFEILDSGIFYYTNIIKDPAALIDKINITDALTSEDTAITSWKEFHPPGRPDAAFGLKKRTGKSKKASSHPDVVNLLEEIVNPIDLVVSHYSNFNNIKKGQAAPMTLLKFFTNTFMGPHTDAKDDEDGHISAVVYLNDNYEGGNLKFLNFDVDIKPAAGSIIVFPSKPPYLHHSLRVKSGDKYLITSFWHSERQIND